MASAAGTPSTALHCKATNSSSMIYLSFTSKTPGSKSLHLRKPPSPLLSLFLSPHTQPPSSSAHFCRITRVSTAPAEYAPPAPDFDFHGEISRLKSLRSKLADAATLEGKLLVLDSDSRVKQLFNSGGKWLPRVQAALNLDFRELFLLKCLVAADQEHVLDLGMELVESDVVESARNSVKTALYALVDMIENFDLGDDGRGLEKSSAWRLNAEKIEDLNKLLRTLGEIEQFYDCIGGVIG